MTINFDELRREREARGWTLQDVSRETLISVEYLAALEQGNTSILPQAYVRAFLREYATLLGLDPSVLLARMAPVHYPAGLGPDEIAHQHVTPAAAAPAAPPPPSTGMATSDGWWKSPGFRVMIVLGGILIVSGIAWLIASRDEPPGTRETPFETVVTESERRFAPPETTATTVRRDTTILSADSLTLHATITDSVWIGMRIDAGETRQYLLPPGAKGRWRARTGFTVTLGNAAAVTFTLDRKPLGTLGKRGAVVRNARITRTGVSIPPPPAVPQKPDSTP